MEVQNVTSPEIVDARKGVVEFLLINHPLDCPVCDQAGECKLQDLGYEHGTVKTRYEFNRREYDMIDIGDKIKLHMNRCILCYRCVKTCEQLTDGRVHGGVHRGDAAEISTYIEKAINNDFSGNVIDVCPVGALTDRTFRFKSRVWFTQPVDAHRKCDKCCGKTRVWLKGEEVLRVTARKDQWDEVEDFICNRPLKRRQRLQPALANRIFSHSQYTAACFRSPARSQRAPWSPRGYFHPHLFPTTMNLLPRLARVLGPALLCAIVATACRNNEQGTRPDAAFTPYIPAFTAGHISARAPIIVRVASGQRWRDSSATALQQLFDRSPR